jgi:hypothetical protein
MSYSLIKLHIYHMVSVTLRYIQTNLPDIFKYLNQLTSYTEVHMAIWYYIQ